MKRAALRIVDESPDFSARSVLAISPGLWRMRNGHTAKVSHQTTLNYLSGNAQKQFPIWVGRCVECDEPRSWNVNGTYAAVGRHGYDIVGPK